jgi:hypothetical protein
MHLRAVRYLQPRPVLNSLYPKYPRSRRTPSLGDMVRKTRRRKTSENLLVRRLAPPQPQLRQLVCIKAAVRAETAHARSERIDPEPLETSTRDQHLDDDRPIAVTTPDVEEQPSRAIQRWPSTVIEQKELEDEVDAPRVEETRTRSATASPTVDHAETVSTPQPSPKADRESTLQQPGLAQHQNSPGRSAHFSRWLSVSAAGDLIHQPPARSVSPVKSALKSARGTHCLQTGALVLLVDWCTL